MLTSIEPSWVSPLVCAGPLPFVLPLVFVDSGSYRVFNVFDVDGNLVRSSEKKKREKKIILDSLN